MEPVVCSTCGVALERGAPVCRVCGAASDSLLSDATHTPHLVKRGGKPAVGVSSSVNSDSIANSVSVSNSDSPSPAPAPAPAPAANDADLDAQDAFEKFVLGPEIPAPRAPELRATRRPASDAIPDGAVHVKAAGFWHRLIAFLIDAAIVGTVAFLLNRASVGPFSTTKLPDLNLTWFDQIAEVILRHSKVILPAIIANLCLAFAYVYFHLVFLGRTPGKILTGLRVIDTKGRKIGPIRAFIRTLAYLPSGLCFGMGFLWAAFDVERRAVHDLIAGTFVVRGQPRTAEVARPSPRPSSPAASALG